MKAPLALLLLLCTLHGSAFAEERLRLWTEYRTILWMSGAMEKHRDRWPLIAQRLRELGIDTGMTGRDGPHQRLLGSGFHYYVENVVPKGLCLKFSSSVTNWSAHVDAWAKTRDESAFVRDYCFDDPQWLGEMAGVVRKAAEAHAATKPLAYDLRDELSVTTSASPFDYDFSPLALDAFRRWLREQYRDLAALNAQWEADFASWDEVRPFSTDRIKARMASGARMPTVPPDWSAVKRVRFDPAEAAAKPERWNFSPWCDHRTYMDVSLARTLDTFRQAAREADPATPVGIEGTQMPSAFGGYDLSRLSQVLDWVEPYDIGNAREIFGSFMPGKPVVATVFEKETNPAMRRLWHLLLLGDRGCIVWWSDDVIDWAHPDLALTAKGAALAPALAAMHTPLARLFLLARRERDPIAIHYSQPSIQVAWLLESTPDGATWQRRFSSYESKHNRHAQVRNSWLKALQDLGWSPEFLSTAQIESGALRERWRVLVLPDSLALTAREREEMAAFAGRESHVLAGGGRSGAFDGRGRLSRAVAPAGQTLVEIPGYSSDRLNAGASTLETERKVAALVGARPPIRIPASARVRTHRFTVGDARLVAFERGIDYHIGEDLRQAGGNAVLETPVTFDAEWDEPREVVDLRTGEHLGQKTQITVSLDPWQPSLYALLPRPMEGDVVAELLQRAVAAQASGR